MRRYAYNGGGFIGVGEPSGHQRQGRYFQLADVLGVEKETGFTLNVDKYNWEEQPHFIMQDVQGAIDFGEGQKGVYAADTAVIVQRDGRSARGECLRPRPGRLYQRLALQL